MRVSHAHCRRLQLTCFRTARKTSWDVQGYGFAATVAWMSGPPGIPAPFAVAGILFKFFGPILLLACIGSRLLGVTLATFMATAGSTHVVNGFFMNWPGDLPAGVEGCKYHLLVVAIGLAIAIKDGGSNSADRLLAAGIKSGSDGAMGSRRNVHGVCGAE